MGIFLLAGCEKEQEGAAPARTSLDQAVRETESGEKPPGKPWVPNVVEPPPVAVETIDQDHSVATQAATPVATPVPVLDVFAEMTETPDPVAAIDVFTVEKFIFKFHQETQAEICGDWDNFIYNGSMMIVGHIQSETPVEMAAAEFELELTTPFESYTLPAQRKRETLSGQERIEQVVVRKGQDAIFYVKDYRVDDDERVYRNDDDETGTLKNFGPLINAVFDWESQRFVLSVTRAELIAENIEPGEVFDLSIWMPRFSPAEEDFDQTTEFYYTGRTIDSDSYDYDGDCP